MHCGTFHLNSRTLSGLNPTMIIRFYNQVSMANKIWLRNDKVDYNEIQEMQLEPIDLFQ